MNYRELTTLGLADKEAKVYLASLELGKASVQKIAQKAEVNRATTYVIIETLMKKGLMSSSQTDKKQYFSAESPEKLTLLFREEEMMIQRKKEYLNKLLPTLKTLVAGEKGKPVVRYFEGKEGMRAIAEELFVTEYKDIVRMIYSYDLLLEMFGKAEIDQMRNRRQVKGVKAKIITNDKENQLKTDAEVMRLLVKDYDIKSDIAIFGHRVRIITQTKNPIGLIIENKEIADTLKILYDLAAKYIKTKQ
jgi:sugar-specific transcriptional regulator TrmB